MRRQKKEAWLTGLAVPWLTNYVGPELVRERFAKFAFAEWMGTEDAFFVPVSVNHSDGIELPRCGFTAWKAKQDGLHISVRIDLGESDGRLAVLAAKCGFLTGWSASISVHDCVRHSDSIGRLKTITSASIYEISLTDAPTFRTEINVDGIPAPSVRTLPSDPGVRRDLRAWLSQFSITLAASKPIPLAPKPAAPPAPEYKPRGDWRKYATVYPTAPRPRFLDANTSGTPSGIKTPSSAELPSRSPMFSV